MALAGHVLLSHEVHSVAQRSHPAYVRKFIEGYELFAFDLSGLCKREESSLAC